MNSPIDLLNYTNINVLHERPIGPLSTGCRSTLVPFYLLVHLLTPLTYILYYDRNNQLAVLSYAMYSIRQSTHATTSLRSQKLRLRISTTQFCSTVSATVPFNNHQYNFTTISVSRPPYLLCTVSTKLCTTSI